MRIVVMPGDDIGPEITAVTMTMLEAVNRAYAPRHAIRNDRSRHGEPPQMRPIPFLKQRCRPRSMRMVSFWDRAA